ncbi:MAG: SDR family oxidoreductase, partial [Deltaproteobacteria bacterium]|nr:SDR family oxidoreductase [Deltaproteobacteria bacterium]
MRGQLEGKVAIITGGTSGIGRRTVEIFTEEGASVLIAARRENEGHQLADRFGDNVEFLKTDVSREADVKRMIDYTVDRFGKLDCLFNNAGVPAPHDGIASIRLEDYEYAMSVMLGGVFLGMKHAAPIMCAQGSGSIINTGSVAGILAGYSSIVYSAAKAAVIHLTRVVA